MREQSGTGANGRGYTSQLASMQEELHQNVTAKDSLAAELQELREKLKVLHFQPLSCCSVRDQMLDSGSKGFFENLNSRHQSHVNLNLHSATSEV